MQKLNLAQVSKGLIFILSAFLLLEGISKSAFYLMPFEIHQRYTWNENHKKSFNGLGAQGDLYLGQPIRIAVFGSSIAYMPNLPMHLTWPQLLKSEWGSDRVQFDNFGIGWNKAPTLLKQLRALQRRGQKYDLVIMYFSVPRNGRWQQKDVLSMHYSSRWYTESDVTSSFLELTKRWLKRRIEVESNLTLWKAARAFEVYDDQLRQSDEVRSRLVEVKSAGFMRSKYLKEIEENIDETLNELKKLSSRILWIPERIAFHPEMKKEVVDKYIIVRRTVDSEPEDPYYEAPASINARFDAVADANLRFLIERNIHTLDLTEVFRKRLSKEDDLFIDEFHLTEKASREAATIIFSEIKNTYPELFSKNENK